MGSEPRLVAIFLKRGALAICIFIGMCVYFKKKNEKEKLPLLFLLLLHWSSVRSSQNSFSLKKKIIIIVTVVAQMAKGIDECFVM